MSFQEIIFFALILTNVLLFYFLLRKNKNIDATNSSTELFLAKIRDLLKDSEHKNSKELFEFSQKIQNSQNDNFDKLSEKVQNRLDKLTLKIETNLNESFKQTNNTFQNIIERLSRIDEAQKQINQIGSSVTSLQDILTDKKSRGIFGEVQLSQVLNSIFGVNDKIYKQQFKLSNDSLCDAILFLPQPLGSICIDSKFPLENYLRMTNKKSSDSYREEAEKEFKRNLKKHIDDIAKKYIIVNETAHQAILFLPAEAIFAEVHAYHQDLIEYAQQKKVWISSPTTMMATLTTIQVLLNEQERDKFAELIHQELNLLAHEFERYKQRWDKLSGHIENVSKDVRDIHITTGKISTRFEKISDVKFPIQKESGDNLLSVDEV